jgi:hypothetical protein
MEVLLETMFPAADLHTLQVTATNFKSSPACSVFSRSLATAFNSGNSLAIRANVLFVERISRN